MKHFLFFLEQLKLNLGTSKFFTRSSAFKFSRANLIITKYMAVKRLVKLSREKKSKQSYQVFNWKKKVKYVRVFSHRCVLLRDFLRNERRSEFGDKKTTMMMKRVICPTLSFFTALSENIVVSLSRSGSRKRNCASK